MGNIPAKITGKYQSYDINTPSHLTPSISIRKQDIVENETNKITYDEKDNKPNSNYKNNLNIDIYDNKNQSGFHETFNEMDECNSNRNSVYNEHPVDVSSDYRADTSENEDYIEHHVHSHLENTQRQIDVMY
ncbi:unnamed protein product [Brachionus calyciflorus]|uniref:Uncharacterized protein n=1 Tax=Brachionus calyciflorus TaxID=104777 RepID=A0A813MC02_9BILA|nr:unnamed protein product [Brachionus calyciflorus]